jgi:hypothetical protein
MGRNWPDVWDAGGWKGFFMLDMSIGYLKVVPMTVLSFADEEGVGGCSVAFCSACVP